MSLILGDDRLLANCVSLIQHLGAHEQRNFLHSILRILSKRHLGGTRSGIHDEKQQDYSKALRGAAALISNLAENNKFLKDGLEHCLNENHGYDLGEEINVRRAVVSALANDHGRLRIRNIDLPAYRFLDRILSVYKKSLESFGDKLSITYTPILRQEGISIS